MESVIYLTPAFGVAALLFAWYKAGFVSRQDAGTDRMKEIEGFIRDGAMAFLRREYSVLAVFAGVVAVLLVIANYSSGTALVGLSFIVGAGSSALAGFFGMRVATSANVRTTNAARESLSGALGIAFSGGSVMGMSVVGLALLGLSGLWLLYTNMYGTEASVIQGTVLQILSGFSLGASSIALCSRVSVAASTPSLPTSAPTSSVKSKRVFPKTIRETLPSSPTTSVTTSATSPAWAPISSSPTSVRSSAAWCWRSASSPTSKRPARRWRTR